MFSKAGADYFLSLFGIKQAFFVKKMPRAQLPEKFLEVKLKAFQAGGEMV